jgi:hypothetical protein
MRILILGGTGLRGPYLLLQLHAIDHDGTAKKKPSYFCNRFRSFLLRSHRTYVALTLAVMVCLMTSCLGRATPKREQVSPNGKYRAELTEADIGAAGGWMSAIQLSEINPSILDSLFGRAKETVFGADVGSSHMDFSWRDDTHFQIRCAGCTANAITLQRTSWKDITISYDISGRSGPR